MFWKTIKVQKTIEQEIEIDEKVKDVSLNIKKSMDKTNDALDQFIGALVERLNKQDKSINEINKFINVLWDRIKEVAPSYRESVIKLQKEVKELKQKVEELEGQISINGNNNTIKVVVDS